MRQLFLAGAVLAAAGVAIAEQPQDRSQTQAQAEAKVKADLARRKDASPEAIRVIKTTERTWPDQGLGCADRRIVGDPVPVEGFRIVLELAKRRFVYHSDHEGRFVPCDRLSKPIAPIR